MLRTTLGLSYCTLFLNPQRISSATSQLKLIFCQEYITHKVCALKTIYTSQFGEYEAFLKVYGKDFSLPTRKKQRNQDFSLVSNFSSRQPLFPTSENILKFTISGKAGDRICTSQSQLWLPHFSKHGQSQTCEGTEALSSMLYGCAGAFFSFRNGWPCTSASKGIQLLVQRVFFLSQGPEGQSPVSGHP